MDISSALDEKLRYLCRVFLAENEHINLSALRTEEVCWVGNVLDSLAFVDLVETFDSNVSTPFKSVLDVGTGGGFPLLPLALAYPQAHFTGVDSTGKKLKAIERICAAVGINNVKVIHERAENLAKDSDHRGKYDVVTARAVAKIDELLPLTIPFTKPTGIVVLWKSMHVAEELAFAEPLLTTMGWEIAHRHVYSLPLDFGERQLLVLRRNMNT